MNNKSNLYFTLISSIFLLSILGSVNAARSDDYVEARFGSVILKLPSPEGLCAVGDSKPAKIVLSHQRDLQLQGGNKLLALWIDCDAKQSMDKNQSFDMQNWSTVVAHLTGNPRAEKVYWDLKNPMYMDLVEKGMRLVQVTNIEEKFNAALREKNKKYFKDEKAVLGNDLINLGILSKKESLNYGLIQNIKTKKEEYKALAIASGIIINGVPMTLYRYTKIHEGIILRDVLKNAEKYVLDVKKLN